MIFLGSPYPIRKHPRGLLHVQNGINQVKSDLLILLLTNPGERCVTGDTKIPLANGTELPIADLVGKSPFWVYSYDHNTNSVVAGKATALKTVSNAELVSVQLDNGEVVRCTPDHLWMLRNGEYLRADQLTSGQSLMPLYRNLNTSKYERVYQPSLGDYRETHLCFVDGKRFTGVREVVHHKDLDKRNNDPNNLQWMTCKDHKDLHKIIRSAFDHKMKTDPEFYDQWHASQVAGLRKYYETHNGSRLGAKLSKETKDKLSKSKLAYYTTEEGLETKKCLREKALTQFAKKGHPSAGKNHSESSKKKMSKKRPSILGESNPSKRSDVREKLKAAWVLRKQKNHKVIAVTKLAEKEDCYDLVVEKYHNFAVSAGVFIHNCMLPQFGTPLRQLVFEPNDETLAERAKQMIIDSINKWEPRITIQNIEVFNNFDQDLDPDDPRVDVPHILGIRILFFDPEDIREVQQLQLDVPLANGA